MRDLQTIRKQNNSVEAGRKTREALALAHLRRVLKTSIHNMEDQIDARVAAWKFLNDVEG